MLPTYACIRQIYLAQHYFQTPVVHREEILIFPCLFIFQVSFSNFLLVLKQLFGCLQLFISKQLLGFCLSKIILLKQLFGANILVLKQLFGATCVEAIIWFFAP